MARSRSHGRLVDPTIHGIPHTNEMKENNNRDMEDKKVEVVDADDGTAHVTFNLPLHENNYNVPTQPQSQRYFTDELSTPSPNYYYPTEQLGRLHNSNTTYTTPSPTIHEVVGGGGGPSSSLTEVTPAFLRRAAQELGVTKSINAAMHSRTGR